jgi:hypothetical protein
MLPPLLPSHKQARDARLCRQGTIFHSAAIVVGHCHPQCIVCAADVVAITQQGKERVTWQGTTIHAVAAFHRRASLDTPLQLSWSRVTARKAQGCQGTFVRTATTLVVAPIVAWLPLLLPTEKGKERPTMPRLRRPLCRRLSALPPLSLSRERARDGRQWRQGTIFRLPPLSSCTIIRAAVRAVERSSHQAPLSLHSSVQPLSRQAIEPLSVQAYKPLSC